VDRVRDSKAIGEKKEVSQKLCK